MTCNLAPSTRSYARPPLAPATVLALAFFVATLSLAVTAHAAVRPIDGSISGDGGGSTGSDPTAGGGSTALDPIETVPLGGLPADWSGPLFTPNEILVKFKSGVGPSDRSRAAREEGATIERDVTNDGLVKVRLSVNDTEDGALQRWGGRADVDYAVPNLRARAFFIPNDTLISKVDWTWNLRSVHAYDAWDVQTGDPRVLVAIIDGGVAYEDHEVPDYEKPYLWPGTTMYRRSPELNGPIVPGWDFIHDDAFADDDNGHGTTVATIVAGAANNTAGAAGVAFGVGLMPIKVIDYRNDSDMSFIVAGIRYAADHGANVANLSLGFPPILFLRLLGKTPSEIAEFFRPLKEAVDYAQRRGVILVGAAGNFQSSEVSLPAGYQGVIAVGATGETDSLASYSSYGQGLDFVAPGGDFTEKNNDGIQDAIFELSIKPYRSEGSKAKPDSFGVFPLFGTSCAAPHVTGAVALLLSKGYPSQGAIEQTLRATAFMPEGKPNAFNPMYGYGLIQLDAAVRAKPPQGQVLGAGSGSAIAARLASSNPARDEASIAYRVTREGRVRVRVFDVRGAFVRTVEDRMAVPGEGVARWDGRRAEGGRAPAGVYFFRIETPDGVVTRKFAFIR